MNGLGFSIISIDALTPSTAWSVTLSVNSHHSCAMQCALYWIHINAYCIAEYLAKLARTVIFNWWCWSAPHHIQAYIHVCIEFLQPFIGSSLVHNHPVGSLTNLLLCKNRDTLQFYIPVKRLEIGKCMYNVFRWCCIDVHIHEHWEMQGYCRYMLHTCIHLYMHVFTLYIDIE